MNEWQRFEKGANWLAWNKWTGETCGGVTPWWGIESMTEENKVVEGPRKLFGVSPERNEDGSRQRWCMASGDSPYASSGCPWSINTGDEMGSNGFRGSSSTEGEGDHQGTTESPSGGNAVGRGETGAKGATPFTIAELRDNDMHDIVNTLSANHRAQELTQDRQTTAEPGPPTVKARAVEMKADSGTDNGRPSAEVGCGRLHQTSAAATKGSKATLQLATTPKQELKKAKTPAQVEAKARKEARREERKAAALVKTINKAQLLIHSAQLRDICEAFLQNWLQWQEQRAYGGQMATHLCRLLHAPQSKSGATQPHMILQTYLRQPEGGGFRFRGAVAHKAHRSAPK